jgi:hypothetical protein
MFWSAKRKARKRDKARIAELSKSIEEVWAAECNSAKSDADKEQAHQIARSITQYDQNELDWLCQQRIMKTASRAGIAIPKEYYEDDGWSFKTTISNAVALAEEGNQQTPER